MITTLCQPPRGARARRSGITHIELMITMMIVLVATLIFSGTVTALNRQRALNAENGQVSLMARGVIEEMINTPFEQVFARYNGDPRDDPPPPIVSPGNRFTVPGLDPIEGAVDGMVGEITFPAIEVTPDTFELRETVEDRRLGMPRDLNGDSILDELDHSGDYYVLPVRVTLRWRGQWGEREFNTTFTLCEILR